MGEIFEKEQKNALSSYSEDPQRVIDTCEFTESEDRESYFCNIMQQPATPDCTDRAPLSSPKWSNPVIRSKCEKKAKDGALMLL